MLEVVKRALGRYPEPNENENYTHVIFTRDEYIKNIVKINDLEENIKKLERDYNARIEHYKNSANDKIAEIRAQADGRVAEAHAEMNKHKDRADNFENANENLIRVATERANAKRGLSPKKQHIGYVFLNIEQYVYNCECYFSEKSDKTKILKLPCFRVRLQSPYQVNFDLQSVENLTSNDFKNKKIYNMLGLVLNYNIKNWYENELKKLWNEEKQNFNFEIYYKANFQKGFWEVEYLTRYMVNVPPDMMIEK